MAKKYIGKTTFVDARYAKDRADYLKMMGDKVKVVGKTVYILKRKKQIYDLLR
jgi:hypothetical protein